MVLPFQNILAIFWRVGERFFFWCVSCSLILGWVFLFLCFGVFCFYWLFKENLKDLFLFRDAIQQHCAKLFHKWVPILPSLFSRRKGPCGKACGKCGSSEKVHYVTQQGTETPGAWRSQQSEQWVRHRNCIFRASKFCVLPLLLLKAATASDSKPRGILTNHWKGHAGQTWEVQSHLEYLALIFENTVPASPGWLLNLSLF